MLYMTRPTFVDMLHFILFDMRPNVPANAVLLLTDITSRILEGVLKIQEIIIPLFLRWKVIPDIPRVERSAVKFI